MILNSLIQGFILGVGAAVPLGPINILIMDRAIQNYKSAVFIGLGALSADITYLFLILLGLVTLFNNTLVVEMLGFFGSAFLFFIAYMIFKGRNKKLKKAPMTVNHKTLIKSFLLPYLKRPISVLRSLFIM